ncbi:MAG: hypothetical protein ACK5LT_07945 [Lachnospirales bacterium]
MNIEKVNKCQTILTDWSIVLYPDIYVATESPETVYAKLSCGHPVALFGRAKNDLRHDAEKNNSFADGHRLVTSPIIVAKGVEFHTQNTIYTLDENDKNLNFKRWCEDNQYKVF